MKKAMLISLIVLGAGLWSAGLDNQSLIFAQDDAPTPSYTPINFKTENGRTMSVQYKLNKAKKILVLWNFYENASENDKSKMKYYELSVSQKDALISEVYNTCSDIADQKNEFCQLYPELVRMLAPIPDKVPGKWMQQ